MGYIIRPVGELRRAIQAQQTSLLGCGPVVAHLLVTKRAARLCTCSTAWMLRAEAGSYTVAAYSSWSNKRLVTDLLDVVWATVDVSLEKGSGRVNCHFLPRCQRVRSMSDEHVDLREIYLLWEILSFTIFCFAFRTLYWILLHNRQQNIISITNG